MKRGPFQKFHPFRPRAGIGDIAGEQDPVEGLLGIESSQAIEDRRPTVISAGTPRPCFHPKLVRTSDDVWI